MDKQDHIISIKNEAYALIKNGQDESERMNEIIRELAKIIDEGRWTKIARAALKRIGEELVAASR